MHRIIFMQGNSLNIIPFESTKKSILHHKSTMDLLFDDRKQDNIQPLEWRKNRRDTYRIKLLFKEIACNIVYDSTLSQESGNPKYYPKVPKYTPPKVIGISVLSIFF